MPDLTHLPPLSTSKPCDPTPPQRTKGPPLRLSAPRETATTHENIYAEPHGTTSDGSGGPSTCMVDNPVCVAVTEPEAIIRPLYRRSSEGKEEEERRRKDLGGMECWWDRVVVPMRRVWINVATRIGIRKSGLSKLRKEVRTCEYEDVHVMWEMLRKTESEIGRNPPVAMGGGYNKIQRRRRRHHRRGRGRSGVWVAVLQCAPYNLCRSF